MKNFWVLNPVRSFVAFSVWVLGFASCSGDQTPKTETNSLITKTDFTYFTEFLIKQTNSVAFISDTPGLSGVDGFLLRKTFSSLTPQDFIGVEARQGNYTVHKGELSFTGNAASNSAVLTKKGFKTFLNNCSQWLQIPITTKKDIDTILSQLKGDDRTSMAGRNSATFLIAGIYERYSRANFKAYNIKTYPEWSIAEGYLWHSKLFDKSRTDNV